MLVERSFAAGIAVLVAGLAIAGCGSSKPTITKAQFVARANAICIKGNKTLSAVEKGFSDKTTAAEFEAFIKGTFVPNVQGQIDAVRALGKPSSEEASVTKMVNLAQTDLNHVKSNVRLEMESNAKPFANFAAVAHPYGLTDCAAKE